MKTIHCSLFTTDKSVEKSILSCVQSFDMLKDPDIIHSMNELIERINQKMPDILFINCDEKNIHPKEILSFIPKSPFIIGLSKKADILPEMINLGCFDCLPTAHPTEKFFKTMSRILNILHFYMPETGSVRERKFAYKASSTTSASQNYTTIRHKKVQQRIAFDDIQYVEHVGNYLKIIKNNGNALYHNDTMKHFCSLLPREKFVRVNKSIVVNYFKIVKLEGNTLYLKKTSFPVSRIYASEIKTRLKKE